MNKFQDSPEYLKKKALFQQLLTIYGRKPVLEALQTKSLPCFRLHLAESNKPAPIIKELKALAEQQNIEIVYHDRQALSRISKNSKQDQGVCLDIRCTSHQDYRAFLKSHKDIKPGHSTQTIRLLALDRITNPQNMGMIIRSACAGNIDGILIPEKGSAKLDALVIKASTGTLFKAPLLKCDSLDQALVSCKEAGAAIIALSGEAQLALADFKEPQFTVYVLGNETEGVSKTISSLCDTSVHIPMNNQVESLNVAVTASLLAFRHLL
ncbi:MAG: TrmH family RNA methyltransferase [Cellvibrionaceae bacterium]